MTGIAPRLLLHRGRRLPLLILREEDAGWRTCEGGWVAWGIGIHSDSARVEDWGVGCSVLRLLRDSVDNALIVYIFCVVPTAPPAIADVCVHTPFLASRWALEACRCAGQGGLVPYVYDGYVLAVVVLYTIIQILSIS